MSSYHRCAKCNSDLMIDGAYIASAQASRIVVGVERHPDRGRLTHSVSTQVHVSVCGSCGYVELWANRPAELLEAYQRASRPNQPAPRATTS
jgi:predicted nucleic-acid-binding Zn-ribbon protein